MNPSQKYISIAVFMAALTMADLRQADAAGIALQNATATFSQASDSTAALGVSTVIDGSISGTNGWAILPQAGQNQTAVFETQADIGFATGPLFTFTFQQLYNNPSFPASASVQHTLGRFRLSFTTDDRSTFADGLESGGDVTANWVVLDPIIFTSQNGATLTEQPDMSILASGFNPATDTYTVTTSTTLTGITGIRLEVLADPSLPFNGPGRRPDNGNFVLTEMAVVPESSSILLVLSGAALCLRRRSIRIRERSDRSSLRKFPCSRLAGRVLPFVCDFLRLAALPLFCRAHHNAPVRVAEWSSRTGTWVCVLGSSYSSTRSSTVQIRPSISKCVATPVFIGFPGC
jgi:hypothetical protein